MTIMSAFNSSADIKIRLHVPLSFIKVAQSAHGARQSAQPAMPSVLQRCRTRLLHFPGRAKQRVSQSRLAIQTAAAHQPPWARDLPDKVMRFLKFQWTIANGQTTTVIEPTGSP
jgi:hypothetical protein